MASELATEQVASLRERLQRQFADLRDTVRQELLAADAERFLDLAGRVHDPGDESVADLLVDLGLAAIDRHIGAIRETEAAILRLRRGTYGTCVDCGNPIGYERLVTEPAASRCVECQRLRERAFVHPGRATL
ncbi:MAG: TraR/DksA family transcriptional regulator [Gammaproteobacteria bacterium]|jgi:RNA polymerase-binding protein DksA|nr:TraR/DksA family transcriptional regulator [Gammaproteobacteria bacterium]